MKRTELIELADAVESQAEDWKDDTDARALARFARQIAESQPVAWMHDGFTSTNAERIKDDDRQNRQSGFKAKPILALYTLPLED